MNLQRFERETHREKLIEAKLREMRLKARQEAEGHPQEKRVELHGPQVMSDFEASLLKVTYFPINFHYLNV